MSHNDIPGIRAIHAIITPDCRVVQGGPMEAFEEAVRRMRREYELVVAGRKSDGPWNAHMVFTVEPIRGREADE